MYYRPSTSYELAVRDFHRARQSAALQQLLGRLRGESTQLLDYEAIRQQLKSVEEPVDRGVVEIPLQKIVGSVGRYQDFTRDFFPKQRSDESRWATVKAMMTDMAGLPPIEVYQIGDAYFVLDGNHRVSVARKLGADTIAAHVTEIQTRVPLCAFDNPDEIICKSRYADFLTQTNLDKTVPGIDLLMTVAGYYTTLLRQIEHQQQRMMESAVPSSPMREGGIAEMPSLEDAAVEWYHTAYLPVIKIIRELGVMRRFPDQTETDIYVLLSERREELEEGLQWRLDLAEAVPTLVQKETAYANDIAPLKYLSKMVGSVGPRATTPVAVGDWRSRQLAMHREKRLFADILVIFEGIEGDWDLLEIALDIAANDRDRILGLYIATEASQLDKATVDAMSERFHRRCESANLRGEFAAEVGDPPTIFLKRAAWADLLLINLTDPPQSNVVDRMRSYWGPVIRGSPRPLLLAPHARYRGMSSVLLAYDGSPKADEALFIATYQASRWKHNLSVVTVKTPYTGSEALSKAKTYLESHGVENATYIFKDAPIGQAILDVANEQDATVIVMGGFGARPTTRLLRGSAIEYILQHIRDQVVMICQ